MLLAIDIGNTATSFGIIDTRKVYSIQSVDTDLVKKSYKLKVSKILKDIEERYPLVDDVVICSVVPEVLSPLKKLITDVFQKLPKVIGKDIIVPVRNRYKDPKQVGQDRLVGAYAAKELYGTPTIIIDLGTAITFDIVSKKGEYEGGMILPGIRLSAEALFKNTALLPKLEVIEEPKELIGRDTAQSILSGIFFGYGEMCSGLIRKISGNIQGRPKVIITGGFADLMKKYLSKKVTKIDPDLVFKGIGLLCDKK